MTRVGLILLIALLSVTAWAAPGFYELEQRAGVWWLVAPSGETSFLSAVSQVRYTGHFCQRLGYSPYERWAEARYGSPEAWATVTRERLAAWGFDGVGELSNAELKGEAGLPSMELLPLGYWFASKQGLPTVTPTVYAAFPNVFHPDWEASCDERAAAYCAQQADESGLIGYYLDNELAWWGRIGRPWGLFEEAWRKPADDPAKQAWLDFLKARYPSCEAFCRDFGAPSFSWEQIAQSTQPSPPMTDAAVALGDDWLRLVAERYFSVVTAAVKRYDPNHLLLGVRFAGDAPAPVWEIAGKYCDAISVNLYPRFEPEGDLPDWQIAQLEQWHRLSGKPLLISEWSFPALDSGLPCTVGAGLRVETQAQRAAASATYLRALASLPYVVGSSYFMWVDEPALGLAPHHPENTNYGLVNERDEPYTDLTEALTKVNQEADQLHLEASPPATASPIQLPGWMNEVGVACPLPEQLTTGLLTASLDESGGLRLALGNTPLGSLKLRMLQHSGGYHWTTASSAKILAATDTDRFTRLELELAAEGDLAFIARCELLVPKGPEGWLALRLLRVTPTTARSWRLAEAQWRIEIEVGGESAGDEPGPFPHMWIPFYRPGIWAFDREAGAGLGVSFLDPRDFEYWSSGGLGQPVLLELRQPVSTLLAPGQSYSTLGPWLFCFPVEADTPAYFAGRVEALQADLASE